MSKSITKRWFFNTVGIVIIILVVLIFSLSSSVQLYYYNSIQQTIIGRSNELVNSLGKNTETAEKFEQEARLYVESFAEKELMELTVINSIGVPVITSTGFVPDTEQPMPDHESAKADPNGFGIWEGRLSSGEKVMAITQLMRSENGGDLGAIRYLVSLENADRSIVLSTGILFLIGILVVFIVVVSGAYFVRSIVVPVRGLSARTKQIAHGEFDAEIEKMYDDEIGALYDSISEMASELKASEKMKNDFISSVSHELRTPLTAIKGWAETMQTTLDDPDKKTMEKGMSVIVKETERLTGIVEELLDFSRIQDGRMVLMMDKTDILAELDEAVYMLRDRALSEKKHLLYDGAEYIPTILGDKNKLRQVFINILDNALKYTPQSGVIGVQVGYDDENVIVTISDNGCGIPAKDLPRIKEKFYKANQTQRGSGIGLALCEEIVTLHNGTLDIESTEGIGTTVKVKIPKIPEDD